MWLTVIEPARCLVACADAVGLIHFEAVNATNLRSQVKPAPTDMDFYAPVLDALWGLFGEDRLIYGSDWPVSDRSGREYADIQRLVMTYFTAHGEEAMEKYFWRNAKAAYKWIDRAGQSYNLLK